MNGPKSQGRTKSSMLRLVEVIVIAITFCAFDCRPLNANPPKEATPKHRPIVTAVFKDGEQVEGTLESFDNGVYGVLIAGKKVTFAERDLASIKFSVLASDAPAGTDPVIADLIGESFRPGDDTGRGRSDIDPTAVPKLAAAGPKVIRPLLAAFKKHDGNYQLVGKVFQQMGSDVFPLLVECVREDSERSARFPVWWALRESGVQHAGFVGGLLEDKDPRIRLLAMDVLYSWSTTSGTVLPKSLDLPLIQILSDPDNDVRRQAPLILGRIGFNSDLVLPALLRTMSDDKFASVRSNSVIALGYLGRDLKATDPELIRILKVLAQAVTDDPSEGIRGYAAFYLGEMGAKASSALPSLQQATDDKKPLVRKKADEAIFKIKSGKGDKGEEGKTRKNKAPSATKGE